MLSVFLKVYIIYVPFPHDQAVLNVSLFFMSAGWSKFARLTRALTHNNRNTSHHTTPQQLTPMSSHEVSQPKQSRLAEVSAVSHVELGVNQVRVVV